MEIHTKTTVKIKIARHKRRIKQKSSSYSCSFFKKHAHSQVGRRRNERAGKKESCRHIGFNCYVRNWMGTCASDFWVVCINKFRIGDTFVRSSDSNGKSGSYPDGYDHSNRWSDCADSDAGSDCHFDSNAKSDCNPDTYPNSHGYADTRSMQGRDTGYY